VGCTLFTKFDIQWGYNNIWIKPGDEWKAAFLTPEGLFEPMVMFFRLTNLLATFQMMMNTIFRREVQEGWFSIFMDDGIIYTKKWPDEMDEQHIKWHRLLVHCIFDILEANDLYIKPEKCAFEQQEIEYLGVIIGKGHLKMDPKKLKGVADYTPPKNPTEVHAFLGFTGYYWYFVQGYLQIARLLLDLTKKSELWHWGEAQEKAFQMLKDKMCSAPILLQPDFNKKIYL
jgi:Reverse transcriptase (RNA-dependent DNA polymerase)